MPIDAGLYTMVFAEPRTSAPAVGEGLRGAAFLRAYDQIYHARLYHRRKQQIG